MSVCGASQCSKKEHCAFYIGNFKSNNVEQVIDWSTYGWGTINESYYDCGDFSDGYPMFKQRELDPKREWIPCVIDNPKVYDKYLVTCSGINIPQIRKYEGEWDSIQKVVAWRCLPPIYTTD